MKTVDEAVAAGFAHTWACSLWRVSDDRVHPWRVREPSWAAWRNWPQGRRRPRAAPFGGAGRAQRHRVVGHDRPVALQAGPTGLLHRPGVGVPSNRAANPAPPPPDPRPAAPRQPGPRPGWQDWLEWGPDRLRALLRPWKNPPRGKGAAGTGPRRTWRRRNPSGRHGTAWTRARRNASGSELDLSVLGIGLVDDLLQFTGTHQLMFGDVRQGMRVEYDIGCLHGERATS